MTWWTRVGLLLLGALAGCRTHPVDAKTSRAIGEMRTLIWALGEYRKECGGFPESPERLLGAADRPKGCETYGVITMADVQGLIQRARPTGVEYVWTYRTSGPLTDRVPVVYEHFEVTATWPGTDRRYSFWTSDAGVIRLARGRTATSTDQVVE